MHGWVKLPVPGVLGPVAGPIGSRHLLQSLAKGPSLLSTLLLLLVGALVARLTASRLARWAVPSIVLPFSRIEPLSGITELGVLMLFFQVGMEVRGGLLGSRPMAVLLSALTPLLLWWPLQRGFGLSVPTTLLVLAVLSATSTGVTLRALAQAGALQTPSARLLVGVSVLDDLPAIALLTLSTFLGQPLRAEAAAVSGNPLLPMSAALALGLLSFPLSRWWLRRHGPWRAGPLGVLLQRLAPQANGGGGDGCDGEPLRGHLALLSEVFLPLYSLSVAMRIEAATLLQPSAWWMALVLLALAIASKPVCGLGISPRDQAAGIDRPLVVFGLIPRGLPGLVFATTGQAAGLISAQQCSALVLNVSGTTVLGLLHLGRRLQAGLG